MSSARNVIELSDLSVRLNNHLALQHLNFSVVAGSRTVVTGQNGAGKTTLLKAILGLVKPTSGTCLVLNHRVGSRQWLAGRKKVAYLNQESVQVDFPISAYEVAEIGVSAHGIHRGERRRMVHRAMEATRCAHLKKRTYAHLSGGEKQKVSLARCVVQAAEILLLDEPCSSLDPDSKTDILNIIESLNERERTTILMVSHDEANRSRTGWDQLYLENGGLVHHQEF